MITISGFRNLEEVYLGQRTMVLRAERESDGLPVILKMLREEAPNHEEIQRVKREHEILVGFGPKSHIVRAVGLTYHEHLPVLIMEDCRGESVRVWLERRKLSTKEILVIGMLTAEALAEIHSRQVIHKDINPANILYNPETGEVKLIDFGIAASISQENPEFKLPDRLEGTLTYISPEQTGRMNRIIDYRTDFYSLGATLYELLCGQPPFKAVDPMEMIHCHIAKNPQSPHQQDPAISEAVSDIIMKLLAKDPDHRYKSAWGLRADLEECFRQLEATGAIHPFELGQKDAIDRLQIPQKLYGRKEPLDLLLGSFERVKQGSKELILVSGPPGIGKSALVEELSKPITTTHGFFASGKFDKLQRNTPYLAFVQAFQKVVRLLLTGSEQAIKSWRERLLEVLGNNAQVIIELLPDMEMILGPQPAVDVLPAAETQNRFRMVIQHFIRTLAGPENPLVVFIDDVQWADPSSLDLINLLMLSSELSHLLLICTYRESEVDDAHPWTLTLKEIKQNGIDFQHIQLGPLTNANLQELLAEVLKRPADQVSSLCAILLNKTQGNPFFVNEFLRSMEAEGLLSLDRAALCWKWDEEAIHSRQITDNVVDLMNQRFQRLSAEAQSLLQTASCIGAEFTLDLLGSGFGASITPSFHALNELTNAGLIFAMPEEVGGAKRGHPPGKQSPTHRFAHDRIQQAAYSVPRRARKAGPTCCSAAG